MPSCPHCGADVILARDLDTKEVVPLDKAVDSSGDAPRYKLERSGLDNTTCRRVPDNYGGACYPDHRFDCAGYQAGRGARLR